jgi:C4-dicarboxylate transporter DctQ subunit
MSESKASPGAEPSAWGERLLDRLPRLTMAAVILVMIAINFANVVSRYVFQFALYWAEEILIFMMVWCVGLGIVVATYRGAHLRMDLVSTRLAAPWRGMNNALTALLLLLSCGYAAVQSGRVLALVIRSHQVSVAASVPVYIPHLALLVGLALMVCAVAVRWRAYLSGRF